LRPYQGTGENSSSSTPLNVVDTQTCKTVIKYGYIWNVAVRCHRETNLS
jgi:hypothetical protein